MQGIISYGVHIPFRRISKACIADAMAWHNPILRAHAKGEKAYAAYDEDVISMGVNAASQALQALETDCDRILLAGMDLPYVQRRNASIVQAALGLSANCQCADITGSASAAADALYLALERGSTEHSQLVIGSDAASACPGTVDDISSGDAAAALLVGENNCIARLVAMHAITADFPDMSRSSEQQYTRNWEERWVREQGMQKLLPLAYHSALDKGSVEPGEISKLAIAGVNPKAAKPIAKKLGVSSDAIAQNIQLSCGLPKIAHPLLELINMLETAQAGDTIMLLAYGSGAYAFIFQLTEGMSSTNQDALKQALERKRVYDNYAQYLSHKGVLELDRGIRGEIEAPTALSMYYREQASIMALQGNRCLVCNTAQYPPQRICVNPECRAIDQFEGFSFQDKTGKLFSYTADNLAVGMEPPAIYGLVDVVGGGRLHLDLADCAPEDLKVGMNLSFQFRRKYHDPDRGIYSYFWKAIPCE